MPDQYNTPLHAGDPVLYGGDTGTVSATIVEEREGNRYLIRITLPGSGPPVNLAFLAP
jgi:hypothetical protein